MKETQLHTLHVSNNARITDFAGWAMPLHYGSQIDEHHAVRNFAGVFDVSHMGVVDFFGADRATFLNRLFCNDLAKLSEVGQALYTPMLNEQGGVIDDLIVYRLTDRFRLVVNASRVDTDMQWIEAQITSDEQVEMVYQQQMAIVSLQGPQSTSLLLHLYSEHSASISALARFCCLQIDEVMIARTGYTGEEGYELILPSSSVNELWLYLLAQGASACGLAARDTLRLEAGYSLYGQELDLQHTPLDSNLSWTVAWQPQDRNFIGRDALERQRSEGPQQKIVGLVLLDKGVLRMGYRVFEQETGIGVVTSGSFSPTLKKSIALARVPMSVSNQVQIEIRNKRVLAQVVAPAFVRMGKSLIEIEA